MEGSLVRWRGPFAKEICDTESGHFFMLCVVCGGGVDASFQRSENSNEWKRYPEIFRRFEEEDLKEGSNTGLFWMAMPDFLSHFEVAHINCATPEGVLYANATLWWRPEGHTDIAKVLTALKHTFD